MRKLAAQFFSLILFALIFFPANGSLFAQNAETMEEAKLLYKEAMDLKKAGNLSEAVSTYEKALRKNRGILEQDDAGLVAELKRTSEQKLASSPEDVQLLETLGFVNAICYSDFEKAIDYYTKVISLTKDEGVKTRTKALVDRLQAQADVNKLHSTLTDNKSREEKVKEWSQMEKQNTLGIVSDRVQKREERIRALSSSKEDLETRLPQMEDKLKEMEEEIGKADLYYRTTENRMYRRKRERLEGELETKKQELERDKKGLEKMAAELEKLQKEAETEQANLNTKPPAGKTGGEGNQDGNPEGNPDGTPTPTPDQTESPTPTPTPSDNGGTDTPPTNNPDFPSDKPASGDPASSGQQTNWP